MNKIWASFIPNFGGSPFESKTDHIASYKAILFAFVLDGSVLWISYQSFLYPELSTVIIKDPFNDLDSLANSDYRWAALYLNICYIIFTYLWCRLYSGPKDWAFYDTLSSTQAYEEVMKNNLDLELSFNSWDISIEKILSTSKSAIFADSAFCVWGQILSNHGKDLPCLVRLKWWK